MALEDTGDPTNRAAAHYASQYDGDPHAEEFEIRNSASLAKISSKDKWRLSKIKKVPEIK